jgi:hypothetical protein
MVKIPGRPLRLVPSRFPPVPLFERVTSPKDLEAVLELEGWTNDRLVQARLERLPRERWVFGRANASVVMAAFLHGSPAGTRFTSSDLSAWYAAFELKTAICEVAHHLRRELVASNRKVHLAEYREYSATLAGDYIDIRGQRRKHRELYRSRSYLRSQQFGERHRAQGSDGIVYDSVRDAGGTNVVAFDPCNVQAVIQARHWRLVVPQRGRVLAERLEA